MHTYIHVDIYNKIYYRNEYQCAICLWTVNLHAYFNTKKMMYQQISSITFLRYLQQFLDKIIILTSMLYILIQFHLVSLSTSLSLCIYFLFSVFLQIEIIYYILNLLIYSMWCNLTLLCINMEIYANKHIFSSIFIYLQANSHTLSL